MLRLCSAVCVDKRTLRFYRSIARYCVTRPVMLGMLLSLFLFSFAPPAYAAPEAQEAGTVPGLVGQSTPPMLLKDINLRRARLFSLSPYCRK